jgi:hypothetical protein
MEALQDAAAHRRRVDVTEPCPRPEALTDAQARTLMRNTDPA